MSRAARRAARRAAHKAAGKAAGKAGRARLADQATTRQRLADAVLGWLALSKAGELGPVQLPVGEFEGLNEAGHLVHVRLVAHVTPRN